MKKIISLVTCLVVIYLVSANAFAAGSWLYNSSTDTVTITCAVPTSTTIGSGVPPVEHYSGADSSIHDVRVGWLQVDSTGSSVYNYGGKAWAVTSATFTALTEYGFGILVEYDSGNHKDATLIINGNTYTNVGDGSGVGSYEEIFVVFSIGVLNADGSFSSGTSGFPTPAPTYGLPLILGDGISSVKTADTGIVLYCATAASSLLSAGLLITKRKREE